MSLKDMYSSCLESASPHNISSSVTVPTGRPPASISSSLRSDSRRKAQIKECASAVDAVLAAFQSDTDSDIDYAALRSASLLQNAQLQQLQQERQQMQLPWPLPYPLTASTSQYVNVKQSLIINKLLFEAEQCAQQRVRVLPVIIKFIAGAYPEQVCGSSAAMTDSLYVQVSTCYMRT